MTVESKMLKVIGQQKMHCGGCENTVKFALKQLLGVQTVEASHKTQRLEVRFDPQVVDLKLMQQELDWIGYQVAEVEEA